MFQDHVEEASSRPKFSMSQRCRHAHSESMNWMYRIEDSMMHFFEFKSQGICDVGI